MSARQEEKTRDTYPDKRLFNLHFDHRPDTRAQQYPGAEQRHLPWSTPQPAGAGRDERRVYYHYVDLRALTFSLVELDSRFTLVLGWIGAAYILWLAWQIAKSKPATGTPSVEPVGFWASLGLQFVNVKIILYGITALSTFVLPVTREPVWLISVSLLLAAIGALGNLCWALAGHLFQRLFLLYGRQLNWMLAALLVYCAVRIVVE